MRDIRGTSESQGKESKEDLPSLLPPVALILSCFLDITLTTKSTKKHEGLAIEKDLAFFITS
jgi:hypothetical protein